MKFTLKDYQAEAVKDVLKQLRISRRAWHEDGDRNAFSLTAATGAGKTVMAAAVFEALFFGSDDFDFEPDAGAVVIWFSDDPSLNEQSRWRLYEASDKLMLSDLVSVGSSFNRESLEAGKVYFLNTQKLAKKSLLVRGHDPSDPDVETSEGAPLLPDTRAFTIWDTIRNTIEDPSLTLYLVLDEAHRGMREGKRANGDGKPTIVRQLINGFGSIPAIPIVWGISATVERFNSAIKGMENRATRPNVVVDVNKVQESGLLKDTITLDVPDEEGDFATVLLRRGADKLREISAAWDAYAAEQEDAGKVSPLMVLQVPNSPDHNEIGKWIDLIFERWPDLPHESVANVFGEHKTENFGGRSVPYIAPERVQETDWVRILVAKDAISTGWDCPRAEVMVSLRRATDKTHITQLLGRMVRTPLARRIPGNERLNAVDCLLPYFNKDTVQAVVDELMTGGEGGEEFPGRRVLIKPKEMKPNPDVPEGVWAKFLDLPSNTLPKRLARPVKRLTALAHELAVDKLLSDAGKKAHAELHKVLDGARVRYAEEIEAARRNVLTVEGKTITTDVATKEKTFDEFVEAADYAVIEDAYRRAGRVISPDVARTYAEHLAKAADSAEDAEEALIEAHTVIAAIGLVPTIRDDLEAAAEKLANAWHDKHRVDIRGLSDERQEAYRQIREMSSYPLDVDLSRPKSWLQPTVLRNADKTETPLPRYAKHLLCDEERMFPEDLNTWEAKVLLKELDRKESVAWYRNPPRASQDSLGITYLHDGELRIVRPDFIFFAKLADGTISADIVDPHGAHYGDALPKLAGLAKYADEHGKLFRRIEAISEIDGSLRVLDLKEPSVRDAVAKASSATSLYKSAAALDYEA